MNLFQNDKRKKPSNNYFLYWKQYKSTTATLVRAMFFNDKEMKYILFSVDLVDIIYFLCLIQNIYPIYNHNTD